MKNFFYGISVFIFLCILSAGYYGTYRMAELHREEEKGQVLKLGSGDSWVPAAEAFGGDVGDEASGLYYLCEKDGCVAVYLGDRRTVYETTSISVKLLPQKLQEQIRKGKWIRSQEELYGFLENYSS